jgi:hypothetical protein
MHAHTDRSRDLQKFYNILDILKKKIGGERILKTCTGKMNWPKRGVYFFYEPGEYRTNGKKPRVVRVGTHALKEKSKSTLWKRLRQHRGTNKGAMPGGGNHRGSVFRLHVGSAILSKTEQSDQYASWGIGSSAKPEITRKEYPIEKIVSEHISHMPFIWLPVTDKPGPDSLRGYFEKNTIALLSNYNKLGTERAIDPPSEQWLGSYATSYNVRVSGLWNSNYVNEEYSPRYLDIMSEHVDDISKLKKYF